VVSPTAANRCLKLETFRLSKFAQWETTFQVLTILGTLPLPVSLNTIGFNGVQSPNVTRTLMQALVAMRSSQPIPES